MIIVEAHSNVEVLSTTSSNVSEGNYIYIANPDAQNTATIIHYNGPADTYGHVGSISVPPLSSLVLLKKSTDHIESNIDVNVTSVDVRN